MKKQRIKSVGMFICLGILIFLMLSVLLRFFTRQILVERLGMNNTFTRLVFFGAEEMGETAKTEEDLEEAGTHFSEADIDWNVRYPFVTEEDKVFATAEAMTTMQKIEYGWNLLTEKGNWWNLQIESIKDKICSYTGNGLFGYPMWLSLERNYEEAIGWNLFLNKRTNEVIFLADQYLTHRYSIQDTRELADSVKELSSFCSQQGIEFLYAQSPFKVSKYQDTDISGHIDFSNQNADSLLEELQAFGISYLDFREQIEEEKLSHHALFYRTDHHWKIETGLWASSVLAKELNENFGFQIELDLLEKEQFRTVVYPDWFLGSQGKKVTLERTTPEDISLLYPTYSTDFSYEIPNLGIHTEGDFSITYDMEQVETMDYYNKNPYGAFNHSDRPVIRIKNQEQEEGHILFIKDSFVNCVAPFLALGVRQVDLLDVRYFDGSVRSFIEENKPDIVIVMYNPSSIEEIDWESHDSTFDFR